MGGMKLGKNYTMYQFVQRMGYRSPAQLCRGGEGGTFPEREPGLAQAPGAHVTPTPHFSRELPKPNPAQGRIMCTG
jgi:hypothetical protein